jgi:hypothetical protein
MDTNTFTLDEIRRELARLGYNGLSKQTLLKFQQDLEDLAQDETTSHSRSSQLIGIIPIDKYL